MVSEGLNPEDLSTTYQVQNRDFHHTLVKICRFVLYDFDSNHFLGFQVLTFHDLAEGTLTQHIENQISIPKKVSATQYFQLETMSRTCDLLPHCREYRSRREYSHYLHCHNHRS